MKKSELYEDVVTCTDVHSKLLECSFMYKFVVVIYEE